MDDRATPASAGHRSRPGQPSRVFEGLVGTTRPATQLAPGDLIADPRRFDSEGDWAFCRFTDPAIPAVRMGYQLGSFAIGPESGERDPSLLQLHLEVMTEAGGHLWIPTGRFPGSALRSEADRKDVRLEVDGAELLHISGWPTMTWHLRSDDDDLEVRLEVDVASASVLPDAVLPHCVFGMWETQARAAGQVRVGSRVTEVEGRAFYDHTRVIHRGHGVTPRRSYLYTTLALDDGSGIFGYDATDAHDLPIEDYCFGIHVDRDGNGTFLGEASLVDLHHDADGLPDSWRLSWRDGSHRVDASVSVQPLPLVRGWGGPAAPRDRASWSVIPLVLDADVSISRGGCTMSVAGHGLAEWFDADRWFGADESRDED